MIAMSEDMPGLVETSTNLASVKLKDNQTIEIVTSQRSADNQAKKVVADQIKNLAESLGAKAIQSDGYPGWKPNLDSAILKVTAESYRTLFHEDAELKAIHAGLECGLFLEKYPELDMVSIGPQMKGVHSPDERLSISSTLKNWLWLTDLLAKLNL
jgi:dipeptidase D